MSKKLTQEYVENRIFNMFDGSISVIGTYIKTCLPLDCVCNKCGNEWSPRFSSLSQGYGCPICANNNRVLTQEHVEQVVTDISNGSLSIVGEYIGANCKIDVRCNICDLIWQPAYGDVRKGHGCPRCVGHFRYTQREIEDNVQDISDGVITVIGDFVNTSTPIICECICGFQWSPRYSDLRRGIGCPKCSGNNKPSQIEVEERITKISNGKLSVIGDYITSSKPLHTRCNICLHEWYPRYGNLYNGSGCPICATTQSKGASQVEGYLINHSIVYETEKRYSDLRHINPLSFDFYLVDYNILIEYDGEQHYKYLPRWFHREGRWQFEEQQLRDGIKDAYVLKNNIQLIRVKYDISLDEIWGYLDEQLSQ